MHRFAFAVLLVVSMAGFAHAQSKGRSAEHVWNELYSKRDGVEHPYNRFLADTVKNMRPGRALDIGMGQGRNALFLAERGWQVTGFDISPVAVKQAQAEARKRGLRLDAQVADVDKFDYGKSRWDLVVGMYMHDYLIRNAEKIVAGMKPGAVLVAEGVHRDVEKLNLEGRKYGHKTNDLIRYFAKLRVRHYEDRLDKADWERSGGKPVPIVRMLAVNQP